MPSIPTVESFLVSFSNEHITVNSPVSSARVPFRTYTTSNTNNLEFDKTTHDVAISPIKLER